MDVFLQLCVVVLGSCPCSCTALMLSPLCPWRCSIHARFILHTHYECVEIALALPARAGAECSVAPFPGPGPALPLDTVEGCPVAWSLLPFITTHHYNSTDIASNSVDIFGHAAGESHTPSRHQVRGKLRCTRCSAVSTERAYIYNHTTIRSRFQTCQPTSNNHSFPWKDIPWREKQ